MDKQAKKMNWNSLLIVAAMGLTGFIGKETFGEIRKTHDAVLQMVPRHEYDVEMTNLKARVAAIELYIQERDKKK
jgi:hypothetical protein